MIVGRHDRGTNGFVFVFYYPCLFLEFKKLIVVAAEMVELNLADYSARSYFVRQEIGGSP